MKRRMLHRSSLPILLLCLSTPAAARIPASQVRSVSVLKGVIRVREHPSVRSRVVGRIVASGRFPVYEVRSAGSGCASRWYRIGPRQWVCSGWIRAHTEPPTSLVDHVLTARFGPWVVGRHRRIPWYSSLRRLGRGQPVWLRGDVGFEVGSLTLVGRRAFFRLKGGGWVAQSDVQRAPVGGPVGVDVSKSLPLPLAFVTAPWTRLFVAAGAEAQPTERALDRYDVVTLADRVELSGQCFWRLAANPSLLVPCADVAVAAEPPPPPPGIRRDEAWLDVDGRAHILYARRGPRVVRIMLVSLGRSTPSGLFTVKEKWLKLTLASQRTRRAWYLQNVPFVVFFWKGFALHAAYWHDEFGVHESAGCVNLSLPDARWVFRFIGPDLPPGFVHRKAVPGSRRGIVRIRNTRRRIHTPEARSLGRPPADTDRRESHEAAARRKSD